MLKLSEDAHGNVVATFSHHGEPIESLTVTAMGEIETSDSAGVVKGTAERLPTEMYLRDSPLAHSNGALRAFAAEAAAGAKDRLDALHRLMSAVNRVMTFDPHQTDDPESAAEAFALRRGRPREFAHIFVACARSLGAPARFVNGYRTAEEEGEELGRPGRTAGPRPTRRARLDRVRSDRLHLRRRALCPRRGRLRRPRRPVHQRRPRHGGGRGRKRHPDRAGRVPDAGVRRFALFDSHSKDFRGLRRHFRIRLPREGGSRRVRTVCHRNHSFIDKYDSRLGQA